MPDEHYHYDEHNDEHNLDVDEHFDYDSHEHNIDVDDDSSATSCSVRQCPQRLLD